MFVSNQQILDFLFNKNHSGDSHSVAHVCPYTYMIILKSCFVLQNPNKSYKFQAIGGSDKFQTASEFLTVQDQY